MNAWDSYQSRLLAHGATRREVAANRERRNLASKLPHHLSYHSVLVNDHEQMVSIINSDALNTKTICTMPGEDIDSGALVEWADNRWLVVGKDPNNEIYTKATMIQCNYLLRWIAADGTIVERWCIISDGTKYLTGETISSYNENGMSLGDTRIAMTIGRDEHTVQLSRANRFLIDDYGSEKVLAYRLTKPFKLGGVYNQHGAMSFILAEVNTEDDDNMELHIADYYKYFPRDDDVDDSDSADKTAASDNRGWL